MLKLMMRVITISIASISTISYASKMAALSTKRAQLITTMESKNSFISYVLINNHRYLVKQKRFPNKQISVVRDALAAYIAQCLKIAHLVDVISSDMPFPGKIRSDWPATIHTIAPGDTVRKQKASIYSSLRLRQLWAAAEKQEEQGLTKNIISQITWHKQLPVIVRLDLMIGNSDRHCGNLCYDQETDSFCAIDMDDSFNKDLCHIACARLREMIEDPRVVFSVEEIEALIIAKKTIMRLLQEHKPLAVIKKMYRIAEKAGFKRGTVQSTPSIQKKLNHYKNMIKQTWHSAHQVVFLLDRIIQANQRKKELLEQAAKEENIYG